MQTDRGRAIAVIVLVSAGLLALVAVSVPKQFGGEFVAVLELLTAFGVGAFVYRGERWAEWAYVVLAGAFAAYAAWLSVGAAAGDGGSLPATLVVAVVWVNAVVTLKGSPDLKRFLEEQRSAHQHAGADAGSGQATATPFRARVVLALTRPGFALVVTVAAFWVASWRLGGTSDSIIRGSEVYSSGLLGSAVMLLLLGIAVVGAARESAYGYSFLFVSSVWFAFSTTNGVRRALLPSQWVPELERELPVGFPYLVAFALACVACAVLLGIGLFRSGLRSAPSERRIKLVAGALLALVLSFFLGRPALNTCRTERAGVYLEVSPLQNGGVRERFVDPRYCRDFCSPAGCDYDACRKAFDLPCERFSGKACLAERECLTVGY